jgi:hypothetical protein
MLDIEVSLDGKKDPKDAADTFVFVRLSELDRERRAEKSYRDIGDTGD